MKYNDYKKGLSLYFDCKFEDKESVLNVLKQIASVNGISLKIALNRFILCLV